MIRDCFHFNVFNVITKQSFPFAFALIYSNNTCWICADEMNSEYRNILSYDYLIKLILPSL